MRTFVWIKREQLETLQQTLDAQTSFGRQTLPALVSGLESGSVDPERAVKVIHGTGRIAPNPDGPQMFGDASDTIEQLISRMAQDTGDFAVISPRGPLARPLASAFTGRHLAGKPVYDWSSVFGRHLWPDPDHAAHGQRSGHQPGCYDCPCQQVHGGARRLATQLITCDGSIFNHLAAYARVNRLR